MCHLPIYYTDLLGKEAVAQGVSMQQWPTPLLGLSLALVATATSSMEAEAGGGEGIRLRLENPHRQWEM